MSDLRIIENLLFDSTVEVTASSEDASFPVSNLTKYLRSDVWRSDSSSGWVMIDTGSFTDCPVDSCVIFFEPGVGREISEGALVKLQASQTNSWSSPSVDITLTYDQTYETYSHFFSASQNYRYWRIYVDDTGASYVEIPKIVLGKSIAFTQVPSSGFKQTMEDLSRIEQTAYGHVYSDLYSIRRNFEFQFKSFSEADLELLWKLFRRTGKTTPVAVALDSQATLYDKDRFCAYCLIASDFAADHQYYSYYDTAVTFREAL